MIWSYDAQGNATRPNHIDAWEAEMSATGQIGLLVKGPSRTRYHYDADARRVLKDGSAALPGSGWTVYEPPRILRRLPRLRMEPT